MFQIAAVIGLVLGFQNCSQMTALVGADNALTSPEGMMGSSNSLASVNVNPNDVYDIIVIAGQSNAAGSGLGSIKDDRSRDSQIFQIGRFEDDNLKVVPATDALQNWNFAPNWPWQGFTTSFAREYVKKNPGRKVLIVPTAKGATSILQWENSGELYSDMKMRVLHALSLNPENRVVAFLWHQGETDIALIESKHDVMSKAAVYGDRLQKLFTSVRADFGERGAFPILAGAFVPSWYADHQAKFDVKDATVAVLKKNSPAYYVSSFGLLSNYEDGTDSDPVQGIHFSAPANIEFGKRYFSVFSQKKNGPAGLLDEDLEEQIKKLYRDILGREFDRAGLRANLVALHQHLPLATLRDQFARSAEAREHINDLYVELLKRQVGAAELKAHQDALSRGGTLDDIRNALLNSQEYKDLRNPGSPPPPAAETKIKTFLLHLYAQTAERDPDESGLDYWTRQYDAKAVNCRGLVQTFLTSAENTVRAKAAKGTSQDKTAYLTQLYEVAYWRKPDAAGFQFWNTDLSAGRVSLNQLDQAFLDSAEFSSVCAAKGIRN
ncbi:MAG: DUF4214 domain-containing protein [Bdellovibrionaceae bacterium]|nr:DUF4214 domain-containing protein [Pseudobdellovibrionaceae bacterium]